ncbi:MAG: hypothetical protein KAH20_13105 [Methylococcales bacterium]|nr:hypothetical protein [Methylococcales bacterium]
MKNKLTVSIVSIFLSTSSQAEIISTSIPSMVGKYNYVYDSRTVPFDMGVRFSSINSAKIVLKAQGINALAQVCNTIVTGPYSSSYSCMDYYESPKAFYRLSSEAYTETGNIVVDSTGWNTTSADLSETSHLLDGKGTLTLAIQQLDFHGYITLSPLLYINDISLVIDGVVSSDQTAPSKDCVEIEGTGTVSSNLDIHLPLIEFNSDDLDAKNWIDLEYLGTNAENKHVWGRKAEGNHDTNICSETIGTGTVLLNTDLFMPSMNFDTGNGIQNIWAKLKYLGKNDKGQLLWQLKDNGYGFNQ